MTALHSTTEARTQLSSMTATGQKETFSSETSNCAGEGMQLAYINTLAENSWVSSTAVAAFGYTNFEESSYWIANTKIDSPIFPWHAGEPNGDGSCIHMGRFGDAPEQWNDANCDTWTWGWVCETGDD